MRAEGAGRSQAPDVRDWAGTSLAFFLLRRWMHAGAEPRHNTYQEFKRSQNEIPADIRRARHAVPVRCAGLGTKSAGRDEAPDSHKQYWAKYDHSLKPVTPAVTLSEKLGMAEPARPATGAGAGAVAAAAAVPAAAPAPAVRSCAEAAPDATLKLIARLEATQGKSQGGSAELDASVVRLAERTQMLSFLRESLYRTCERAAAGQISKEESRCRVRQGDELGARHHRNRPRPRP